ncbi:unnamed protein product [Rotaria socialis]|uniref:Protein-tyrosine-phosphatase n=1 Tax=Rotaria socialis TaxID=392032 RepID=A0A821RHA7_9BILA|nr:unnamed protein product [Rotaria socialis]
MMEFPSEFFPYVGAISVNGQLRNVTHNSANIMHEIHSFMMDSMTSPNSDISTKSTLAADVYKITNENNNFRSIGSFEKKISDSAAHVTMPLATYIHSITEDAIVDNILKENGRQLSTNITSTTTTTIQICSANETNAINVTNLTSSTFTAAITYDCGSIEPSDLEIHYDTIANCSITKHSANMTLNSTVDVTCQSIENQAGRNFTFVLTQRNRNQLIDNETFIVTLEPLPLNNSAYIVIIPDESLSSASITVQNCEKIAELEYLVFECGTANKSNRFLLENCTQTCDNLQPGSSYEATLIRLPIPVYGTNRTFLEDRITQKYQIGLDKTKNMTFNSTMMENGTGIIHFTPPREYYETIHFECVAKDQNCSESVKNLTASISNCSNYSFVLMSKVIQGVNYVCHAMTIKRSFNSTKSDDLSFNTTLKPVLYNEVRDFNSSRIMFNFTHQSDYNSILFSCDVVGHRSQYCSTIKHSQATCSTNLETNGTRGCDYNCSFTTRKMNYSEAISQNPPIPMIKENRTASRWIHLNWTTQNFRLITQITSNHLNGKYELRVELNANHRTLSEPIIVKTKSEAPKRPAPIDVEKKIVPQKDDKASTTNQYVINVDLSLFSDEYGIVEKYLIYVRQDLNNNDSEIFLNGTYTDAWHNTSFDYLAVEIPIISLTAMIMHDFNNITVLLGNETECLNKSLNSTRCNGPLKPSTSYKVIVGACTDAGCTHVLSKQFQTHNLPSTKPGPGSSKSWVIVFPLLFLVIIASLAVWKRKQLEGMIGRKTRQHVDDERDPSMLLSSVNTIPTKKPKSLFKYVNMTNEDERSIYDEYQELDDTTPQHRQSECDLKYKDYDRYSNISARGPWDSTAVRLRAVGSNPRDHDYINANEIKGLHGEKQYIACQGPLQGTREDFWDMIIQYGVKKIVMLTRTEEQNPHNPAQQLPKCAQYFPEKKGGVLRISRISIEVIDIENQPDLEIRHLVIKYDNNDHHVFHYYFTGWPDFSVVDPQELINLIENINKHKPNRPIPVEKMKEISLTPIVVHCSAGVGRTGTYIAVDIIMSLIERQKNELSTMKLDVMGIVYQLRQDRGKMVQTKDQYMLVNNCVEEYLRRTNRLNSVLKSAPKYQTTIHTAELTSTENRTHSTNSNDTAGEPVNEQCYKRT